MKRDKIISLRVNSNLLNEVNEIINNNTVVYGYDHKIYHCKFGKQYYTSNKYSIADLLEEAMQNFINKNK